VVFTVLCRLLVSQSHTGLGVAFCYLSVERVELVHTTQLTCFVFKNSTRFTYIMIRCMLCGILTISGYSTYGHCMALIVAMGSFGIYEVDVRGML
jgi:hypothetical protein